MICRRFIKEKDRLVWKLYEHSVESETFYGDFMVKLI